VASSGNQEIPAVVIIDAGNELENLELVYKMKSNPDYVNTKIIITASKHNKTAILNTKADLYLPKPYEIAELLNWVNIFMQEVNNN
jgi:DNA-binding response OmpR family regulator